MFGFNMQKVSAEAYGRVNLIGEHTDYNGGWVLPTSIPQKTQVYLQANSGKWVTATSEKLQGHSSFTLGQERRTHSWIDYVQGITHVLLQDGHSISGFDVQVESSVPIGSGLSSSAALEISLLKALREAFHLSLTDVEIAKLGQRAENDFVGARVGIMDQMACTLAREGEALFLDTRTLNYERISLPLQDMDVLVINSGITHSHAGNEYNERRSQCEEACRRLGIQQLRDLSLSEISRLDSLPDLLKRRARHVITENQRVHEAAHSLRRRDLPTLGELFIRSHQSMRDDYETSLPEIDTLVEGACRHPAVFGARLTGGGFGGSIVALTEPGWAQLVAESVIPQYDRATGRQGSLLVPAPGKLETFAPSAEM